MSNYFKQQVTQIPENLVSSSACLSVSACIAFTEGPAVDESGSVFFSDIANSRIMKRTPNGEVSTFRMNSGRSNGNMFDKQGRLVTCEGAEEGPGGRRRIVRTDLKTENVTVLTDRFEGKRYNSPNDLAIDSKGRIYFTDPHYRDRSDLELDVEAVYRLNSDGRVEQVLSQPSIQKPNGIAISPDDKTLYIVDSNPIAKGNRKIWAFAIDSEGEIGNQRLVYNFAPGRGGDGMRLDMEGNLWIACGVNIPRSSHETADVPAGVCVVSPSGNLLGQIPIPEDLVTNLAFGGPDKKTLYVTAGKTLFSIQTSVSGFTVYPSLQS